MVEQCLIRELQKVYGNCVRGRKGTGWVYYIVDSVFFEHFKNSTCIQMTMTPIVSGMPGMSDST